MELTREEIDVIIGTLEDIDYMGGGMTPEEHELYEKIIREVTEND